MPKKITGGTFRFTKYELDLAEEIAIFSYEIEKADETFSFTEELNLSGVLALANSSKKAGLHDDSEIQQLLQVIHIIIGISYWKIFCPENIIIGNYHFSSIQATFWNTVYTKGLGEFFYKNDIDYRGLVHFPFSSKSSTTHKLPQSILHDKKSALLGLGGGKDSVVAYELLKKHKFDITGFILETGREHEVTRDLVESMNLNTIIVKRRIDPKLFQLNKREDVFNGHIPISAIIASIGLFVAHVLDISYIVVGNECSANDGNVSYLGKEINHQWSKSYEFEKLFQDYTSEFVTKKARYFSLLRPFSEIHIAKLFSKFPAYFDHVTSCNANFQILKHTNSIWCGKCPKCVFVFTLLSAFIPKQTLTHMFHTNIFENASLLPIFKQLLGLEGSKPFECVGTEHEMLLALLYTRKKSEYQYSPILTSLNTYLESQRKRIQSLEESEFSIHQTHAIPLEISSKLYEHSITTQ